MLLTVFSRVVLKCLSIVFLFSWICTGTALTQSEPAKFLAEIPRSLEKVPDGTEVVFDSLEDKIRVKTQVDSVIPISVNVSPLKGLFTRDELTELSTLASYHSQRISRIQSTFPNSPLILNPTSVHISVAKQADKAGADSTDILLTVVVHIKGSKMTYGLTMEGKPEIWRVEKGRLVLLKEAEWVKMRL